MNFREKGGGHSNPKNTLQILLPPQKKRNIVFRDEGGGSEAVWSFTENSSKFVTASVPYSRTDTFLRTPYKMFRYLELEVGPVLIFSQKWDLVVL